MASDPTAESPLEKRTREIVDALPLKKPGLVFPRAPLVREPTFPHVNTLPGFAQRHQHVYEELLLNHWEFVDAVLGKDPVRTLLKENDRHRDRFVIATEVMSFFDPDGVKKDFIPGYPLDDDTVASLRIIFTYISHHLNAGESPEHTSRIVMAVLGAIAEARENQLAEENQGLRYFNYKDAGFQEAARRYNEEERFWNHIQKWEFARLTALREVQQTSRH